MIDRSEAESQLGLVPHELKFSCVINPDVRSTEPHQLPDKLQSVVEKCVCIIWSIHVIVYQMTHSICMPVDHNRIHYDVTT